MRPPAALTRVVTALPGELRAVERSEARVLLLSGPPSPVAALRTLLTENGDPELVQRIEPDALERPELAECAALVHVIEGEATPDDEEILRRADRRRLPILCLLLAEAPPEGRILPYVPATDVVRGPVLRPEAIDALAERLSVRAPEDAWGLAARLPALRDGVRRRLVRTYALRGGALGALSERVPGPDLPALALLQVGMALRLAALGGREARSVQAVAAGGALGAGVTLRALARTLASTLPVPSWAVRGAVAYAGTRALGEAALALERRRPVEGGDGTDW